MALQITQELETNLGINISGVYVRLDIKFGLNGHLIINPFYYPDKSHYVDGKHYINDILSIEVRSMRFKNLYTSEMSLEGAHSIFQHHLSKNHLISSTIVDLNV